ncbi:ras GEF [Basidiobolus meristosporus CBS 931.73]|uniref:Ras GEF n=1 Tax=Basidiobolus meristosporus CBS 931.73 TaxID=1314790 RepID=A0A1Y1ZEA1_9FUNG|nr:ras GEF [Basidiobolus meristosporus CBS 931.73]|eukprot:ORY08297.1 ras GEF [Basidiobolus meristosporus CBS 931.73]
MTRPNSRKKHIPITTKAISKIKFLEVDGMELACQLTILDSFLYNRVSPIECIYKAWCQKEEWMASNIKNSLRVHRQITNWLARVILLEKDTIRRIALIEHIINIANRCNLLHNFNTTKAILDCLSLKQIQSLEQTWQVKHFGVRMRYVLSFLGKELILQDHEEKLEFDASDMIQEIEMFQHTYSISPIPEIQAFIDHCLHEHGHQKDFDRLAVTLQEDVNDENLYIFMLGNPRLSS